jgi:hypothetical protein
MPNLPRPLWTWLAFRAGLAACLAPVALTCAIG